MGQPFARADVFGHPSLLKLFLRTVGGERVVEGLLREAITGMFGDGNGGSPPGSLRPINTGKIAREMDLDKVGAENGRNGIPSTDATQLDSAEQKIIQRIEGEWGMCGGDLLNDLRAYASRLIGYSIDAEFSKLQLKANGALASLRAAEHRAGDELGHLKMAYVDARSEFDAFKEKHRLERPARDPAGRWTTFGLLFVLIAFESVLNGFFFAPGTDYGIAGGIGVALGISSCNVAFAFGLGLGPCRWVNHRNIVLKLLGLILSPAGVGALVLLHAFAAHFRDVTLAGAEDGAMATAVANMLRAPWDLKDPNSIYLFALGILFGLMALWKGYSFDDPYPSYGSQSRRLEEARSNYSEEHSELFDDLEQIKDDTIRDIETGLTRIPLFPQQAANIRAQRAAKLHHFRAYEAQVETATNELLARYRDKNREARTTPPPAHFDQRWTLPHSFLESGTVKELMAEPNHESPDIPHMLSQLQVLSTEVLKEYEDLITAYPRSSEIDRV